jgi:protein-S-isoprenylcysteine O-methyltransferase Ste14
MAVGAGLVMLIIVANRQSFQALTPDNSLFLAQSLLLYIVFLVGIRVVVDVPAALESNWVFRATESVRRNRYISGLKKAILFNWLLPLSALVFLMHFWLWADWRSAFNHAVFGLVISGLGIEALFFRFRKIPFASSHVPGKLKLQTRGVLYLLGFVVLLAVLSSIEKGLLRNPGYFWIFFAISAIAWTFLRLDSARFLKANPLIYEEEPEQVMIVFPDDI